MTQVYFSSHDALEAAKATVQYFAAEADDFKALAEAYGKVSLYEPVPSVAGLTPEQQAAHEKLFGEIPRHDPFGEIGTINGVRFVSSPVLNEDWMPPKRTWRQRLLGWWRGD